VGLTGSSVLMISAEAAAGHDRLEVPHVRSDAAHRSVERHRRSLRKDLFDRLVTGKIRA
jgi:hypothetical protein